MNEVNCSNIVLNDGIVFHEIYSQNGDTVGILKVRCNNTKKIAVRIQSGCEITDQRILELEDVRDYMLTAKKFCLRSEGDLLEAYYAYINDDQGNDLYYADFNGSIYTVFSVKSIGKYEFKEKDYYVNPQANDSKGIRQGKLMKQLFWALGFLKIIIDKLGLQPIIIAMLNHKGNHLLFYIMQSVRGKADLCKIRNPKESKERLSANNVFQIKDGKSHGTFGEVVEYIFDNNCKGSFIYTFESCVSNGRKCFPININTDEIRCNVLVIGADFFFEEEEATKFYAKHRRSENYYSIFKKFVLNRNLEDEYNNKLSKYKEKSYNLATSVLKEDVDRMASAVEITVELLNECFGLDFYPEELGQVFIDLYDKKALCVSTDADEIMRTIIKAHPNMAKDIKNGEEKIAVQYSSVVRCLEKNYPGHKAIKLLDIAANAGYICYKESKRDYTKNDDEAEPRYDEYDSGSGINLIRFWGDEVKKLI